MNNSPLALLLASVFFGIWAALSPDTWFNIAGLVVATVTGVTAIVLAFRAQRRALERRRRAVAQ
ncbi:MAG: hypothetical protein Q4D96_03990 [Propionibacteriaceae bacterium]|nr:hypothetical protein [Propionibacteriaceae bacterium]